jgi:hypothetical protein
MYGNAFTRIGIYIALGLAAAYSPPYAGHPYSVDAWMWRGLRDLDVSRPWCIPLAVSAAMVIADCIGAWMPSMRIVVRRPWRGALGIALVAGLLLWLVRVPNWLGDLNNFQRDALPWAKLEAAEPLGALTTYYTAHWGAALGLNQSVSVALVVTAFGATAVAAMFLWARLVSAEWPLVFAMLVSSGFIVLFCGYPEKGTPKSVALVCWYVYFATLAVRERRAVPSIVASLLLSLGMLMHGSVLCWLPAHAWFVWRRERWGRAALGVFVFLAPVALVLLYARSGVPIAGGPWGNITAPWQWIKAYCITNCGYDFWSFAHFTDILNCLLVLSPVAVLCLPEALWWARGTTARWLALGALGWLFLSLVWFPVFGYVSDWDIFAGTPLVLTYLAIFVALQVMPPRRFRRLAFAWIAGTLPHTVAWWRFFVILK